MKRYDDFEIECPKCGTKFKVDCDTCGYSIDNGFCKWNTEHHDDPCTSDKYRWKPKKIKQEMNGFETFKVLLDYANENELYDNFDDLELELSKITKKAKEWEFKVKKIYDEMKEKGVI